MNVKQLEEVTFDSFQNENLTRRAQFLCRRVSFPIWTCCSDVSMAGVPHYLAIQLVPSHETPCEGTAQRYCVNSASWRSC